MSKERSSGVIRRRLAALNIVFLLACHPSLALFAQGSGLKPAEGLENWKEGIDLGSYAPGKYNLVVEGKDKAGNVTRAAPMNVYVDPKSDLPIISVINPTELMRVGGDLNVVGTAVDDDGIDHVELRLDGGEWRSAEGKEFWSLYLKTADIPEGRRSLDVRAVDVNGLAGPAVRVRFDLDRTKPLPAMDAPAAGSLVSGQIRLVGSVYDANGLRSLEISQDGGAKWSPIAIKSGWTSLQPSFAWTVDTRKLGDGPKVFMLRGIDMVGSRSIAAYLLFVDNTKPTIELARPSAGGAVHGRFAIAGAVRDAVGVKGLSYEFGPSEKGQIPLTAGDPFFVKELDASAIKGDSVQLALVAEDRIGNVTRLVKSLKIDRAADKPVLKVLGPASGAAEAKAGKGSTPALMLRPGEAVWGSIRDDDGAAAFRWSLDGGAPAEVPCSSVFSLRLPEAASGRHALSLTPIDRNGTAGDPVALQLYVDKGPSQVIFDRLTSSKNSRDFAQGIETAVDSGESLELTIVSPNALASAEYAIAGGKRLPLAKAEAKGTVAPGGAPSAAALFRIPLDRSLPYGFAPIEVFAKDAAGNEFGGRALLYVTDYGVAREEPGFRFSDPRIGGDGLVVFGAGAGEAPRPLLGAFYGGELAGLRFEPPTDLVTASFEGRTVALTPAKEGRSAPTRIYGRTTKGREFSAGPFVFETDATPPSLSMDAPAEGTWFNGKLAVSGKVADGVGVARLSWRVLPDGQARSIEPKKDGGFSFELSASDFQPGPFSIELEASDAAGNAMRAYRSLGADAAGPKLRFVSPEKGAAVRGPEDVVAMLQSASGVASVEYAADGKSFEPIERSGSYFAHRADLAANPNAAYRVKDAAGNVVVARPEVTAAASAAGDAAVDGTKAPLVTVLYPEAGVQSLPGPFPLVLKVEGASASSSVEIALGGAKAAPLPDLEAGGSYFATMIDPRGAPKGSALAISLVSKAALAAPGAKGGAKAESKLALKYGYDAAADSPAIALDSLVAESVGLVSGRAGDDDGPAALRASVDGGEALVFASGAFAFSLPPLAPGKHVLLLEAAGQLGEKASVKKDFAVKAGAPALGDFKIGDGKSLSPWSPGADFALGQSSILAGSLSGGNGERTLAVSFNGAAAAQASVVKAAGGAAGGAASFSVPLPPSLPYGLVAIELRAKDSSGLETLERLELHKILPPASGSDDGEALRFSDARILEGGGAASFLLSPGESLVGRFNGRPISAVAIVPATPSLAASFDGSSVAIQAKAEGLAPSAKLELKTVDGESFEWGPFSAAVDAEAPRLQLSAPADDDWDSSSVRVAGSASDPQGIASLTLSVNGGDPVDLLASGAPGGKSLAARTEAAFDAAVSLAGLADGPARLDFVLRDGAGRESRVSRYINKDATPPVLSQVLPAAGESVNGLTTYIAEASDAGGLSSVTFAAAKADKAEELALSGGLFSRDLDLARLTLPLLEGYGFVASDKAGNKAVLAPELAVDKDKDKPVVEIDMPSELEVLRGDFAIAGSAYDDDGLAAAYYRIDGGDWTKLAMDGSSFSISVALKDTTDNEHLVEVKAEDIYGVQGDLASRRYRISKEEPKAILLSPAISKPVRGKVRLSGGASDANGIKEVSVSVDNRASYGKPVGTESWSLDLDTTTLSDGIHAVAVRPVDGYDTEGFYASMISVDNTPPKAQLDLPLDGEEVSGKLELSGRVSDNVAVARARIEIAPVGSAAPPALVIDLGADKIAQRAIDVSSLKPGVYTVRLVAVDRADNEALASRDIKVLGEAPLDSVSILFPMEGDSASGKLRVQGRAVLAAGARSLDILADGAGIGSAEPDELGWFSFEVPTGAIADGERVLKARAVTKDGRTVESPGTRVEWKTLGPWVSIDSFPSGKYLKYRPFLAGRAGWLSDEAPSGKEELAAYKETAASRRVARIDVSLDDGMTYAEAKGTASWSFRLETQDFKEGALHVIVRATYADGTSACAKGLYYLDKTPPQVAVLAPTEGGRFNGELAVSGRAWDENGLQSIGVALRKGDKASYEVPSFIQGLYFDGQMLGATDWQAGLGLSFFDDNVKLEAIYGKAPDYDASGSHESFYGDVFGGKLIANVLYLPAASILGPDWSFLSTSFGLGANFSYFTQTQAGSGLFVGSIFAQLEFPKISFSGMSAFKKISTYAEFQLWVLSSVVDGGFIPKLSFGARVGVF